MFEHASQKDTWDVKFGEIVFWGICLGGVFLSALYKGGFVYWAAFLVVLVCVVIEHWD